MRLDKGELLFTLPDLFRFVQTQAADAVPAAAAAAEVDYVSFRHALYAGNVNTELRRLGAVIVIDQGHDDHTLRLYRLIRLPD